MVDGGPRRSSRKRAENVVWHRQHKRTWLFGQLDELWRQHYLDLGKCRLGKCRDRLLQATDAQLAELPQRSDGRSFLAMAIAAASAYGSSKERELCAYAEAAIARGLDPNDTHHDNTAVVMAVYHGYLSVLSVLLEAGCSLVSGGEYGHAVMAAVRNRQHAALSRLLQMPEASVLIATLAPGSVHTGDSVLFLAIERRDTAAILLLTTCGGARLSDHDLACLNANKRTCLEKRRCVRRGKTQ
jgi:hypothetical protein